MARKAVLCGKVGPQRSRHFWEYSVRENWAEEAEDELRGVAMPPLAGKLNRALWL